jgi:hypothetical protein
VLTPAIGVVLDGHEGARLHAVDVKFAVQMVDFVLQDSGVPSFGFDVLRIAMFVEAMHADAAEARHLGGVAIDAETTLEKFQLCIIGNFQSWIDEHVKGNRHTGAGTYLLGSPRGVVLGTIFDDGELQAESDLRGGETYAGREAKGSNISAMVCWNSGDSISSGRMGRAS